MAKAKPKKAPIKAKPLPKAKAKPKVSKPAPKPVVKSAPSKPVAKPIVKAAPAKPAQTKAPVKAEKKLTTPKLIDKKILTAEGWKRLMMGGKK